MPLILLVTLAGYVLLAERLLTWLWWRFCDRKLLAANGPDSLDELLREVPTQSAAPGWPRRTLGLLLGHSPGAPTPLTEVLAGARLIRELGRNAAHDARRSEQELQALTLGRLPEVEARIATIGWLGGILPMLGLLGTVSGMITTFADLSVTTSRQILSQGLSEALWTTEAGLLGALPLLAGHHLLSRLKSRWMLQLERRLAWILAAPHPGGESHDP